MGHHELSADLTRARYEHALDHYRRHGQRQVGDAVKRLVRAHHAPRRRAAASGPNWTFWRALGELGLLRAASTGDARPRPGPLVWMTVMEEFGYGLVAEPFIETVVAAGGLILRLGSSSQHAWLLPPIAGGEAIWAVAHEEAFARHELNHVVATATRFRDGYLIQGAKVDVRAAPWAGKFIVSARTSGARRDDAGVSLFVVDAQNRGITLDAGRGGVCADTIVLSNVYVETTARLGEEGEALAAMEASRARCVAALCAQATGAIAGLIAIVRRSANTVSRPDRWNDMLAAQQDAVALTQHLSARLSVEGKAAALLVSRTKSQVGYAARFVLEEATNFIADGPDGEAVARYGQCIHAINAQHGDLDFHQRRVWETC